MNWLVVHPADEIHRAVFSSHLHRSLAALTLSSLLRIRTCPCKHFVLRYADLVDPAGAKQVDSKLQKLEGQLHGSEPVVDCY